MKKKWDNWGNDSRLPLAKYEDMSRNAKYWLFVDPTLFFEIYTRHLYPERSSKLFKPDSHYDPFPGFLEGQTIQWPKEKGQIMIYKTYTENNRSNNTNLTKNQG